MSDTTETKVRAIINQAVKFEIRTTPESVEVLTEKIKELKQNRKRLTALKKTRPLSFGEILTLNCVKLNLRQAENSLLYRQAQIEQGTTGPVRLI